MSENENKVIELGDWKIELKNVGHYYTLARVYHNGKEVNCRNVRIYLGCRDIVSMDIDGVRITP